MTEELKNEYIEKVFRIENGSYSEGYEGELEREDAYSELQDDYTDEELRFFHKLRNS